MVKRVLPIALMALAGVMQLSAATALTRYRQTNLVSNQTGVAHKTDANLVNAWGLAFFPTGPFWVSDNGSGVTTLYRVNPATNATTQLGLVVAIPGNGSVTGQVFNTAAAAGAFNKDNFLFVSEDGTISGWRGALGTSAETLQVGSSANVYKGVAFATVSGHSFIYAANFRNGTIDVVKGDAGAPNLAGGFVDPNIPAGYAPFNIQTLNGKLYVTYALQNGAKHDDVEGSGHGFVSVFDLNGNFLNRVASQGALNSPWGLVIAPGSFGAFSGDLLVGNFGDGRINAFDPNTNNYIGPLRQEPDHSPLSIDGLWGLTTGNGGSAGSPDQIYFSAGPDGESHGLFGSLRLVPEPSSFALAGIGVAGMIGYLWRRRARA